jgi:2-methylcitrate dehydratase
LKNLSRRDFSKAIIAATAVGGLAPGYSLTARGGTGPENSLSTASPVFDSQMVKIADYVEHFEIKSDNAYSNARLALLDALACGFLALPFPECVKMLGPIAPGTVVPNGARVPGTEFELDPVAAAFNIGCMVRWQDFSDESPNGHAGHPSDNLGGVLASADYLSRVRVAKGKAPLVMRDVLTALTKAYEIECVRGLDLHVCTNPGLETGWLVKVATAAVVTKMFGGTWQEILNAVSQAFVDLTSLRLYRDPPTQGTRKSWGGADSASRGVWLALITLKGEMGYPTALTAKKEGVYDVLFNGVPFELLRPYGSWAIENNIFKVSFPAGTDVQSALEAAARLRPLVKDRLDDIEKVTLTTFRDSWSWSPTSGEQLQPLTNSAARDHSLQYSVAVVLIFGNITWDAYSDRVAADPRIDALRAKMVVVVDKQWGADSLDPNKYTKENAIQIQFKDGTRTPKVDIQYPLGHPIRRAEAIPLLMQKFKTSLGLRFSAKQQDRILSTCLDQKTLESTPVNEFMEAFVTPENPVRASKIAFGDTFAGIMSTPAEREEFNPRLIDTHSRRKSV